MKNKFFAVSAILILALISYNFILVPSSPSATIDNLKAAIIGETTASAKYMAYSKKAKEEGYDNIALLFEAASKSENIHANNHRAVIEQMGITMEDFKPEYKVKSTKENLQDAINGESYEVTTMYPDFIKKASQENANLATISFNYAYQTEKKHKVFYQDALDKLNKKQESSLPTKYYVCPTCGNTYDSNAPKRCGISMTPKERFILVQ